MLDSLGEGDEEREKDEGLVGAVLCGDCVVGVVWERVSTSMSSRAMRRIWRPTRLGM
jgi:hypothetical protein